MRGPPDGTTWRGGSPTRGMRVVRFAQFFGFPRGRSSRLTPCPRDGTSAPSPLGVATSPPRSTHVNQAWNLAQRSRARPRGRADSGLRCGDRRGSERRLAQGPRAGGRDPRDRATDDGRAAHEGGDRQRQGRRQDRPHRGLRRHHPRRPRDDRHVLPQRRRGVPVRRQPAAAVRRRRHRPSRRHHRQVDARAAPSRRQGDAEDAGEPDGGLPRLRAEPGVAGRLLRGSVPQLDLRGAAHVRAGRAPPVRPGRELELLALQLHDSRRGPGEDR